jgi:hypothetical protein
MKYTIDSHCFSWRMVFAPAAVLLLLWLPFGFRMIGLIEEWDLLDLFTTHGLFFYTHLDGPLAPHALRPLMPFSFALAHSLSPDSFAGWHALMITALLAKGVAMAWLGLRASGRRSVGVMAGVLIILYPADTMQLSFRSLHINLAGALALVAAAFAVHAVDTSRRAVAHACATAAGVLFLCGGLMYEAAFTLVAMPLAVILVRHGMLPLRRIRERWTVVACWAAAPLIYGIYAIWIGKQISSYQSSVIAQSSGVHYALSVWPDLFRIGASRALVGGWVDAALMGAMTFQNYVYLIGATAVLAMLCAVAVRPRALQRAASASGAESWPAATAVIVRMLVAGLVMMLMGYAPFMLSAAHMAISQRTYLWATPGAVFAWLAVLMLFARAGRPAGAIAAVMLMALGLAAQLFQFHHYVNLSERQRTLLQAIVDNFDGKPADKKVVVLDGSSQLGHDWMFIDNGGLQRALSYLYGYAVASPEVCRQPSLEWGRRDALGRPGHCSNDRQGWTFTYPSAVTGPDRSAEEPPAPVHLDARQVLPLPIAADSRGVPQSATATAHQESRAHGDSVIARRYRGILEPRAAALVPPMFKDQFPQASWRFDFGDWWSLEEVPYGSGWRQSEWLGNGLEHRSVAWKVSPEASLYLQLQPIARPYVLRGVFTDFVNGDIRNSMRAMINGQQVDLEWAEGGRFEAAVPQGVLTSGRNELILKSPVEPKLLGLSARLDWVALDPKSEK